MTLDKLQYSEAKDTRSGFGAALKVLGEQNPNVVVLCADLTESLKMEAFQKAFPERFFNTGIAEANMISLAAGMAIGGKIPFTGTFANFSTGRVYDQIRQSVCYSDTNVKICASHAGISLGEDGATHQILEDLGMMKMLPGMTVINTADYNQTYAATLAIADFKGAVYLRFGRPVVPNFYPLDQKFEIGKAWHLQSGSDVSIIATGHLLNPAIEATLELAKMGISAELINIHTLKPLDAKAILDTVQKTGAVVTAEEHMYNGGLGDSVAQLLAQHAPHPMEYVAINDQFGQSGKPQELMDLYGLNTKGIVEAAKRSIARKK